MPIYITLKHVCVIQKSFTNGNWLSIFTTIHFTHLLAWVLAWHCCISLRWRILLYSLVYLYEHLRSCQVFFFLYIVSNTPRYTHWYLIKIIWAWRFDYWQMVVEYLIEEDIFAFKCMLIFKMLTRNSWGEKPLRMSYHVSGLCRQ